MHVARRKLLVIGVAAATLGCRESSIKSISVAALGRPDSWSGSISLETGEGIVAARRICLNEADRQAISRSVEVLRKYPSKSFGITRRDQRLYRVTIEHEGARHFTIARHINPSEYKDDPVFQAAFGILSRVETAVVGKGKE